MRHVPRTRGALRAAARGASRREPPARAGSCTASRSSRRDRSCTASRSSRRDRRCRCRAESPPPKPRRTQRALRPGGISAAPGRSPCAPARRTTAGSIRSLSRPRAPGPPPHRSPGAGTRHAAAGKSRPTPGRGAGARSQPAIVHGCLCSGPHPWRPRPGALPGGTRALSCAQAAAAIRYGHSTHRSSNPLAERLSDPACRCGQLVSTPLECVSAAPRAGRIVRPLAVDRCGRGGLDARR